jgi:CheY-like chemotaxis protein
LPKKLILVVDDSESSRLHVINILSTEYECIPASDGQEGLRLAAAQLPDAVIADLEMPGMDGVEMLRALRARPETASLPVIILTTSTNVTAANDVRRLGCSGFVLKPVQPDYLLAKMRTVIAKAPAHSR